jgi:hypothetical protein
MAFSSRACCGVALLASAVPWSENLCIDADRFARRVSTFDRQALKDIKYFVNNVSLPSDEEFLPQWDVFWRGVARHAAQARISTLLGLGLQQRSDVTGMA